MDTYSSENLSKGLKQSKSSNALASLLNTQSLKSPQSDSILNSTLFHSNQTLQCLRSDVHTSNTSTQITAQMATSKLARQASISLLQKEENDKKVKLQLQQLSDDQISEQLRRRSTLKNTINSISQLGTTKKMEVTDSLKKYKQDGNHHREESTPETKRFQQFDISTPNKNVSYENQNQQEQKNEKITNCSNAKDEITEFRCTDIATSRKNSQAILQDISPCKDAVDKQSQIPFQQSFQDGHFVSFCSAQNNKGLWNSKENNLLHKDENQIQLDVKTQINKKNQNQLENDAFFDKVPIQSQNIHHPSLYQIPHSSQNSSQYNGVERISSPKGLIVFQNQQFLQNSVISDKQQQSQILKPEDLLMNDQEMSKFQIIHTFIDLEQQLKLNQLSYPMKEEQPFRSPSSLGNKNLQIIQNIDQNYVQNSINSPCFQSASPTFQTTTYQFPPPSQQQQLQQQSIPLSSEAQNFQQNQIQSQDLATTIFYDPSANCYFKFIPIPLKEQDIPIPLKEQDISTSSKENKNPQKANSHLTSQNVINVTKTKQNVQSKDKKLINQDIQCPSPNQPRNSQYGNLKEINKSPFRRSNLSNVKQNINMSPNLTPHKIDHNTLKGHYHQISRNRSKSQKVLDEITTSSHQRKHSNCNPKKSIFQNEESNNTLKYKSQLDLSCLIQFMQINGFIQQRNSLMDKGELSSQVQQRLIYALFTLLGGQKLKFIQSQDLQQLIALISDDLPSIEYLQSQVGANNFLKHQQDALKYLYDKSQLNPSLSPNTKSQKRSTSPKLSSIIKERSSGDYFLKQTLKSQETFTSILQKQINHEQELNQDNVSNSFCSSSSQSSTSISQAYLSFINSAPQSFLASFSPDKQLWKSTQYEDKLFLQTVFYPLIQNKLHFNLLIHQEMQEQEQPQSQIEEIQRTNIPLKELLYHDHINNDKENIDYKNLKENESTKIIKNYSGGSQAKKVDKAIERMRNIRIEKEMHRISKKSESQKGSLPLQPVNFNSFGPQTRQPKLVQVSLPFQQNKQVDLSIQQAYLF